jgi:hypothetical protein
MHRGDTIATTGTARPDVDDAFWMIVTGDDQWVRAEFDAIIEAGWDTPTPPPPPAPPRPHNWPRPPARRRRARFWLPEFVLARPCRHDQRSPPDPPHST